jgi:hypothetical protein
MAKNKLNKLAKAGAQQILRSLSLQNRHGDKPDVRKNNIVTHDMHELR